VHLSHLPHPTHPTHPDDAYRGIIPPP
jgi:hypothetical protein